MLNPFDSIKLKEARVGNERSPSWYRYRVIGILGAQIIINIVDYAVGMTDIIHTMHFVRLGMDCVSSQERTLDVQS